MHRGPGRSCSYDGKIAGLYDLEETLGRGHFAVVKLARHVFTGEKVAVKVIDKSKLDDVSRAHLFQEVRCMKLVQHPNVVRLYEVIDTQTKLYLILELGDGGDLYDYIMKHDGGLGEEVAREYFRQIVRAISYCHRLHVVHRDLKPENVVFFERLGMVKLTDFGFSNRFNPGQKLETSCGSLAYSAPEILLGDSYDAPAVDVWSLGVILYMLVCGQAPFQEANDSETLTMIMDCKYTIPVHVSEGCKRLIARMLIREPEKRASLEEIAADPWLGEDLNTQPADFLPLVSREHVSEEDHALIIQKMVNGNIATKEEILEALDKNEYNHITATYFLLAERKLRAHRQEQAQQRLRQGQQLQELSPISSGNKPYVKVDKTAGSDGADSPCSQVNQSLLSVARTPGDQNYRTRKCSIVQEEEDEDDMTTCTSREELAPPHGSLNRRGSRSEGKLNLALQERLVESERRKDGIPTKTSASHKMSLPPRSTASSVRTGIIQVGVHDDISRHPGMLWASPSRKTAAVAGPESVRPKSAVDSSAKSTPTYVPANMKWRGGLKPSAPCGKVALKKPNSLISICSVTSAGECPPTTTSIITESSTISIPIHSSPTLVDQPLHPKYKTMPSPTRPLHSVLGSPPLNEIFEEGESVGELVRTGHTPRGYVSRQNYEQRRSRFHKTRTASCSSSDASDDDSESRKKRAHKISGDGKPLQQQRRDSHDDSSDSQDPSGSGGAGGGSGRSRESTSECNSGAAPDSRPESGRTSTIAGSGSKGSGGGGRRQCRRRPGETRLRESQSLNRITEVQEAELSISATTHIQVESANQAVACKTKSFGGRLFQGWPLTSSCTTQTSKKSHQLQTSAATPDRSPLKSGNFKKEDDGLADNIGRSTSEKTLGGFTSSLHKELDAALLIKGYGEGKENCCKAVTAKTVPGEKQKNSGTKKGRLLSRYFQVHKKLCLPLPGLFGRGRLYKAQSCSSIVRDRMVSSAPASLLLCGEERWCPGKVSDGDSCQRSQGSVASNGNSKNSDIQAIGDINQNLGAAEPFSDSLVPLGATCPGIGVCQIHLGDASRCCSLC